MTATHTVLTGHGETGIADTGVRKGRPHIVLVSHMRGSHPIGQKAREIEPVCIFTSTQLCDDVFVVVISERESTMLDVKTCLAFAQMKFEKVSFSVEKNLI